jgi:hypothetical protein
MVAKVDSKLADKNDIPQIGNAQPHIADVSVSGTYADDDDALAAAINSILAVLEYHGLVKTS